MSANMDTARRYMYILTVAENDHGRKATTTGTIEVAQGTSRMAVCDHLIENGIKGRLGFTSFVVLYFSLEPDVL